MYKIEEELTILDPKRIRIEMDDFNRMRLITDDGKEYPDIKAVMGFPLTSPDELVSLFSMKNGKKDEEIGVILDVGELDAKSRKILRRELSRSYFMPRITRIISLKEFHGILRFEVETDRGIREFETRYREDIRKLPGGCIIIKDADGNRYQIKDYRKLDKRSMELIDTEI